MTVSILILAALVAPLPATRAAAPQPPATPAGATIRAGLTQALNRAVERAASLVGSFLLSFGPAPGASTTSNFFIPDPTYIGYGPREHYSAPQDVIFSDPTRLRQPLGGLRGASPNYDPSRTSQTGASPVQLHQQGSPNASQDVKPVITDIPGLGTPCGSKPGDTKWHWRKPCKCGDPCGPGSLISCQSVFCDPHPICTPIYGTPILRHDPYVETLAEAKRQSAGHAYGGNPVNICLYGL